MYALSAVTTYVIIVFVGGLPFLGVAIVLAFLYYSGKSHWSKPCPYSLMLCSQWVKCMDKRRGTCVVSVCVDCK
jgi:ABC-type enterochelin transport system permease subunit